MNYTHCPLCNTALVPSKNKVYEKNFLDCPLFPKPHFYHNLGGSETNIFVKEYVVSIDYTSNSTTVYKEKSIIFSLNEIIKFENVPDLLKKIEVYTIFS
jgi:hypothetical protein